MSDHYLLLGLEYSASEKEIKKAYRSKALQFHPDKNPDDSTAAEMFQLVQSSYDILSDPVRKLDYDKLIHAKLERQRRELEMNQDRLLAKQQLEMREKEARKRRFDDRSIGLDQLKQQGLKYQQDLEAELSAAPQHQSKRANLESQSTKTSCMVEVRWTKKIEMTRKDLQLILSKYNCINDSIVMSEKKSNKAIVEFSSRSDFDRLLSDSDSFPFKMFTFKLIKEEQDSKDSEMSYEQDVLFKMQNFGGGN